MKTLLAVAVLVVSGVAYAGAPFCVQTPYGSKNCWYFSADACYRAAAQGDGICVPNQEEEERPKARRSSGAPFCVVTSYGNNCYYYSARACYQAAGDDGMCIPNPDNDD